MSVFWSVTSENHDAFLLKISGVSLIEDKAEDRYGIRLSIGVCLIKWEIRTRSS